MKYSSVLNFLFVYYLTAVNCNSTAEIGDLYCHPNTHQEFRNYILPPYLKEIGNIHSTYLLNETQISDNSFEEHIALIKDSLIIRDQSENLLKQNSTQSCDQHLIYKVDDSLIDYIFDQINIKQCCEIKVDFSLKGYSDSSITLLKKSSGQVEEILIVIKTFQDKAIETKGLLELGNLVVADQIINESNPESDLKFSRVLGAFCHTPSNQPDKLSIIFEGALGQDIDATLNQLYGQKQFQEIDAVFASIAVYLARFHQMGFNKFYQEKKFKNIRFNYINKFTKKFHEFTLNKQIVQNLEQAALTYEGRRKVKKRAIDQQTILSKINLDLEKSLENFRGNTSLTSSEMRPTITHGDIHSGNVFFNSVFDDSEESYKKITLIDYETMIESFQFLTHPAQDIGRFLGSIWRWSTTKLSQHDDEETLDIRIFEQVKGWQENFINIYMNYHQIDNTASFRSNILFHIKNFFRVLFKDSKPDYDQLAHILQLWLYLE